MTLAMRSRSNRATCRREWSSCSARSVG